MRVQVLLTSLFLQKVSNRSLLTSSYFGLPYMHHKNCLISVKSWSLHSGCSPNCAKVDKNSSCFSRSLTGPTLPLLTNALTVSQPVKQWIAGKTEQMSTPFLFTIDSMSINIPSTCFKQNGTANLRPVLAWEL